jgi:hypothetical protein
MRTWPNTDVLWSEHWHHWADRRAWRADAPRQTPDAAARPAITNSNPSAECAERRTRTASRCTCVCVHYAPVPHRCERHSTACACALCAADKSSSSGAICSTVRPAGAIVHDEARGAGARYVTMPVLRGLLPPSPLDRRAPTARTDGTSSVGSDGARGRRDGWVGVVRRRAGCTSLSPAS